MTKLPIAAAVSALALVTGMAALAQDLPTPPPEPGVARPVDGMVPPVGMPRRPAPPLTRDAAMAAASRGFAMIDTDHDGVVTRAEYDAWRQQRAAIMAARRGGDDGAPPPPPMQADANGAPPASRGGGHGWRGGHGMGGGGPLMGARWFEMADADRDGRVTAAEAQGAASAAFDRMDTDHDGILTPEERRAGMMAMRGDRAGG